MILEMSTEEFSKLNLRQIKGIFGGMTGTKVNEIVFGSMTNNERGEYRIRHDECAYSNLKVEPTPDGKTHILIYNFRLKEWIEEA